MDTTKPKKALRSLFLKTEPLPEEIQPSIQFKIEERNLGQAHALQDRNEKEPASKETKNEKEPAFKVIEPLPETKTNFQEKNSSQNKTLENTYQQNNIIEHSPVLDSEQIKTSENNIATGTSQSVSASEVLQSIGTNEVVDNNSPYSFVKIQYNLDLFKAERRNWQEPDYVSFINRIDQAQTDAFFLKGKLVAEIKERFYLDNKRGWALFCDETLNMNYTTANQYIRVAQEFDVTSHQRKDFGFEHFKALLPLSKEERNELLTHTPSNLSVKSLRDMVSKKLTSPSLNSQSIKNQASAKQVVDTLQKLKTQLSHLKNTTLSQEEIWQLYGAFQNLADDMTKISNSLISSPEAALQNNLQQTAN